MFNSSYLINLAISNPMSTLTGFQVTQLLISKTGGVGLIKMLLELKLSLLKKEINLVVQQKKLPSSEK